MESDLYRDFAERYDLYPLDAGSQFELTFQKLFGDGSVRSVLDCACGTGREILLLRKMGFDAVGSDISESMLSEARKNLARVAIDARLEQADYRNLPEHFDRQFDAVMCLRSSIAHMPDDHQALRAFISMFGVLRAGGLLVLSQGTTERQWRERPKFILQANTSEVSRLIVADYESERDAVYSVVDIFHSKDQRGLKVWSSRYHFLFRSEQHELLREAGFQTVDFYGDYSLRPYDEEASQSLITVACK